MKPELREKYRGWFCWFLQRKIDAEATAGAVTLPFDGEGRRTK